MSAASILASQIQSTAGAIPVVNEKGEISMQKVKVHRYISGRRPKYAPEESSNEESEEEGFPFEKRQNSGQYHETDKDPTEAEKHDPRLRRLQQREYEEEEDKRERHRHIHEPQVISTGEREISEDEEDDQPLEAVTATQEMKQVRRWRDEDESSEEEELDDDEIDQRRALMRQRAKAREEEKELLNLEEEENKSEADETEESEYEEYTDSEEEVGQRLKPVFVRKRDRVTVQEKEKQEERKKELEVEAKHIAEERRWQSVKIVENETRKEQMEEKGVADATDLVITDDENDEAAYETWKLRELKRIKRDKEEREQYEKERLEIERVHSMTEEERRAELRVNPKTVTNKPAKGKYKFLQKYYHRGVFYLDEDDTVLKRDFSAPTLEDHFNKTILPKVMQVKNFGRSGCTKYTHLVDQDTTQFDSPWMSETANNLKFHTNQAAGMKQVFERPTVKKRKKQ